MTVLSITLPWPPKELSPNARLHWSKLARAKKAYRYACAVQAKAQGAQRITADKLASARRAYRHVCAVQAKVQGVKRIPAGKLHVSLTFYAPTRRAFDLDNALARMKSGLDGLADVLGVDDRHWSLSIARAEELGGMVKVEVRHV